MNGNAKIKEAIIILKNGQKKYGMLVDEQVSTGNFQFVSNDNAFNYNKKYNMELVEMIPAITIESIETDLK